VYITEARAYALRRNFSSSSRHPTDSRAHDKHGVGVCVRERASVATGSKLHQPSNIQQQGRTVVVLVERV